MFGSGKIAEVPSIVKSLSDPSIDAAVLLVVDARPGAADPITKLLEDASLVSNRIICFHDAYCVHSALHNVRGGKRANH